jgi:hypothetical protein
VKYSAPKKLEIEKGEKNTGVIGRIIRRKKKEKSLWQRSVRFVEET